MGRATTGLAKFDQGGAPPDLPATLPFFPGTTQLVQSTHTANNMFGLISVINTLHTLMYVGMESGSASPEFPLPHRISYARQQKAPERFLDMLRRTTNVDVSVGLVDANEVRCFERLVVSECIARGFQSDSTPTAELYRNPAIHTILERIRRAYGLPQDSVQRVRRVLFVVRPLDSLRGRAIVNQDAVLGMLKAEGLEVRMQDLESRETLDDVAHLVSWADMVIAAHGASLSNIAFARKDTVVLEIMPWGLPKQVYKDLSRAFDLRYEKLQLTEEQTLSTPQSRLATGIDRVRFCNLEVDVQALRAVVAQYV